MLTDPRQGEFHSTIFHIRPTAPNVGNDLIADATADLLRSVFDGHVNIVSLPASGPGGVKGAGLTSATVYELNQLADGVIIGPGNLFENGALTVEPRALSTLTAPVAIFGVSTGRVFDRSGHLVPRTDSTSEDCIAAVCRAGKPILVRDGVTRDRLAASGCPDARVIGCPALFAGAPSAHRPVDPGLEGSVLLSIRHPDRMSIPYSARGRTYVEVRRIIDYFTSRRMSVRLLCHDYRDLPFAQSIGGAPIMYTEDAGELLAWLRACRLSVTFRLHAFIGSLAVGVPSIPITYDERAMGLVETIGLSGWPIDFLERRCLIEEIDGRCRDLQRLTSMISEARPVWDALREETLLGLQEFASRVDAHRKSRVL